MRGHVAGVRRAAHEQIQQQQQQPNGISFQLAPLAATYTVHYATSVMGKRRHCLIQLNRAPYIHAFLHSLLNH